MRRLATLLFSIFILVIFDSAIGSAPCSAQQPKKVKFVLDWAWQAPHAFWTLADDRGYFLKEGLEVTIDRGFGSGDTISKVAAKSYDIGFADGTLLMKFNAANPGDMLLNVLIVLDASPNSTVFFRKSGITKPKDLEGKTLSATKGEGASLMFPVFAKMNNLDTELIKWKHVEPRLRDILVIQDQADATVGWVTTSMLNMMAAGVKREDIGYLLFYDYGVRVYSSGLLVRKDYAENNPEVVGGFVRATIKGIKDAVADGKTAIDSLLKRDPLLKRDIEMLRLELVKDIALLTPNVLSNGISSVDSARFESVAAQVSEAFNLTKMPKMEDVYSPKFLPPQSDRMVKP